MRPGLPDIEIDSTIFRPATFIELSMDNLTRALIIGAILVIIVLVRFSLRMAGGIDQRSRDSVVPDGCGRRSLFAGAPPSTPWSWRDSSSLSVTWWTTRSSMSRISCGACASTARQGSDKSTARIILDASLEVRSAIVHATMIVVLAVDAGILHGRTVGRVLRTPGSCLSHCDAGFHGRGSDGHTGPKPYSAETCRHLAPRASPLVPFLKRIYGSVLSRLIQHPRATFATALVFVVAGIGVWPFLGHVPAS